MHNGGPNDMASTNETTGAQRSGRADCRDCHGDGATEHAHALSSASIEPSYLRDECQRCGGSGAESCPGCGEPAKEEYRGVDPTFVYCSPRCAFQDDNWPACTECEEDPQDPPLAPFCCAACEASFRHRVDTTLRSGIQAVAP
jgi:hypothetical protein